MIISFWSNSYEQSMVSYNLAAVSIASVMRSPYRRVTVLENHLHKDNLGHAFLGAGRMPFLREVGTNYYEGGGIEGLLRRIYRGVDDPAVLRNYWKEIIPNHLFYLPQSGYIHNEVFDYEFNLNHPTLFRMLSICDLCYIDTAPMNLNSKAILEAADLIVVNLCQNQNFLEDFVQSYSSLIPKAVFLIGNYTNRSILSRRRISELYDIPLEGIAPIPWNQGFQEARSRGRAVEFITGNYRCANDNPNYSFIQSIRRAAGIIMKQVDISEKLLGRENIPCGI